MTAPPATQPVPLAVPALSLPPVATTALDVLGGALIVAGVVLTLVSAIGLLRMPDVLTRMHAQSIAMVSGLLLVLGGVALQVRSASMFGALGLMGLFQLLTGPTGSHMIGRAARRARHHRPELLVRDDADDG